MRFCAISKKISMQTLSCKRTRVAFQSEGKEVCSREQRKLLATSCAAVRADGNLPSIDTSKKKKVTLYEASTVRRKRGIGPIKLWLTWWTLVLRISICCFHFLHVSFPEKYNHLFVNCCFSMSCVIFLIAVMWGFPAGLSNTCQRLNWLQLQQSNHICTSCCT